MYPVTINNLKRLAVQRGAVGFDYSVNSDGEIDWYRFGFAFESAKSMESVESPSVSSDESHEVHFERSRPIDELQSPVLIPEPIPVLEPVPFASIPQRMRDVQRWCVWKKHKDDRKIPYRVLTGGAWSSDKRCSSIDPSEWVSFDEALHCYLKSNGYLGGLSFALGDRWCGVDFDDVIVNGMIYPQAKSWLASLGGYQEVSQSGKGIKTYFRGVLSDVFLGTAKTGRKFNGIPAAGMATEVYDRGRFFFLTGNGSGEPLENQVGLDALCDELLALKAAMQPKPKPKRERPNSPASRSVTLSDDAILDKIRSSRQASKFEALWAGQIGAYPSASEADMALTSILMGWCQNDKAQVERLFERSGLAKREKWDREDYRERTLAKAESDWTYQPRVSAGYSDAASRIKEVLNDGK